MAYSYNQDLFQLVSEELDSDGNCICQKSEEDRSKVFGLVRNMPMEESELSDGQVALTSAAESNDVGAYVQKWLELNNLRR